MAPHLGRRYGQCARCSQDRHEKCRQRQLSERLRGAEPGLAQHREAHRQQGDSDSHSQHVPLAERNHGQGHERKTGGLLRRGPRQRLHGGDPKTDQECRGSDCRFGGKAHGRAIAADRLHAGSYPQEIPGQDRPGDSGGKTQRTGRGRGGQRSRGNSHGQSHGDRPTGPGGDGNDPAGEDREGRDDCQIDHAALAAATIRPRGPVMETGTTPVTRSELPSALACGINPNWLSGQ